MNMNLFIMLIFLILGVLGRQLSHNEPSCCRGYCWLSCNCDGFKDPARASKYGVKYCGWWWFSISKSCYHINIMLNKRSDSSWPLDHDITCIFLLYETNNPIVCSTKYKELIAKHALGSSMSPPVCIFFCWTSGLD
jgi:hypothetical protein